MQNLVKRLAKAQSGVTQEPLSEEEAKHRARRRLLLVCIPLFWSSWHIYSAYLSVYAKSLGASLSMVGMIAGIYGLTQLILRIPLGVLCDRLGRRKLLVMVGVAFGALGALPMLLLPNPLTLVIGRGMAGVGAAFWVPLSTLLVLSYPQDQVAKATGRATAASGLGSMLASFAGGMLAEALGVRAPFWVGIGCGAITVLLLSRIKEPERAARGVASIGTLLSVGRMPMVLTVSILAMLSQYNGMAMTAFVPLYAAQLNANSAQLGQLMAISQACRVATSFVIAHVSLRLGTKRTVVLGSLLVVLGTLLVPSIHSLGPLFLLRALSGIGMGTVFPVLMAGALSAVPTERRTAAMGFFQAIYAWGMVSGPAVSGLFAEGLGLVNTFYAIAALGLLATVAAAIVLPHRIRSVEPAH